MADKRGVHPAHKNFAISWQQVKDEYQMGTCRPPVHQETGCQIGSGGRGGDIIHNSSAKWITNFN